MKSSADPTHTHTENHVHKDMWPSKVGGGGGWHVRRGVGAVGAAAGRRPGLTERAGILRKPYASHKTYNVGSAPVFINSNL